MECVLNKSFNILFFYSFCLYKKKYYFVLAFFCDQILLNPDGLAYILSTIMFLKQIN